MIRAGYGVIVLLLFVVGIVSLTRGAGGTPVGDDDGNDDENKGGSGFVVRPEPPAPTTRFVRRRTTTEGTTSPTPDKYQEPASTPRRAVKQLVTQYDDLVLCTLSHRAKWDKSYPPEGQCDFLFYTSVRYHVRTGEFNGAYDKVSYELFLKKAKAAGSSSKTGYGASFEYEYAQDATSQASKLNKLWNSGVYHFGILHIWDNAAKLTAYNYNLNFLREVKKKQDSLGRNRNVHRALGFQVKSRSDIYKTRSVLAYLQRNYPVTILITVTHTIAAAANDFTEGPTSWAGSHNSYAMNFIADEWRATTVNDNVTMLLSFSMAAANWKLYNNTIPVHTAGSYRIRSWSPSPYEPACLEGRGLEEPYGWYLYRGNWNVGQLLTWDNSITMVRKALAFFAGWNAPKEAWPGTL